MHVWEEWGRKGREEEKEVGEQERRNKEDSKPEIYSLSSMQNVYWEHGDTDIFIGT